MIYFSILSIAHAAPIKGLEFLGEESGSIGELFVKIYNFGIGIVALAAFVTLVLAGVMYLTAGDNESRATQAKKWIWNAIIGLVIALLSYLILFTINPDFVKNVGFVLPKLENSSGEKKGQFPCPAGQTALTCDVGQKCIDEGGGNFSCLDPKSKKPQEPCPPGQNNLFCDPGQKCIFSVPLDDFVCNPD